MTAENPPHDRRWLILVIVAVGNLMLVLDFTIINVALPAAQRDLGFSGELREWVVTAYGAVFGPMLLLGGRVADLLGRKRTLIVGLVGFAVASAAGGAAQSFAMLVAARAAQGAFGGLLAPAALSVLATTFTDPGERGKAFGVFGATAGLGGGLGLVLGGVLTETLSWRWALYVNVAIALLPALAALRLMVNQAPPERRPLDLRGTVTATAGLVALIYGVSRAQTSSWQDPVTIATLAAAAVLLVCFVVTQSRAADPLLPLHIVTDRTRGGSYLAIAALFGPVFTVLLFLSFYLQRVHDFSPIETGLAILAQSVATVATVTVVTPKLLPRVGPKPLLMLGLVLGAGGTLWLAQLEPTSTYTAAVLPPLLVIGLGMGTIVGPAPATATYGVDPDDSGIASGAVETSQFVGGSVGLAVLSTIAGSAATTEASVDGITTAFYAATGIFLGGALAVSLIMPSISLEPTASQEAEHDNVA